MHCLFDHSEQVDQDVLCSGEVRVVICAQETCKIDNRIEDVWSGQKSDVEECAANGVVLELEAVERSSFEDQGSTQAWCMHQA